MGHTLGSGRSRACYNGGQAMRPTFSQFSGIQMPVIASIMSLAGYMLPFLFVLSLVVFSHELGHFLIGRWCGVKVETFSLGFGPEIYGFDDRHGTHWRVAALPLGGFVKFHGDANDALIPGETFMKT